MFSGAGEAGKSSFMSVDNNKFINLDNTGFNAGEWQDGREYFLHKAVDDVSIIKNTNDVQAYRTIQTLETRTTGSKMQLTYNIILPKNKNYAIIQIKHKNIGTKTFTLDNLPGNIHDGTWAAALNPKNPYKAYINGYGGIDFSTVGLWQVFSPPKNKPFVTFYDENNNAATYGFISGTSKPIQYVTNGKPRKILDAMVGEVTLKPGEETEYVIMIALHTGDETNGEKLYDDAVTNTPKIISSLYEGSYQDKKNKCELDNGKVWFQLDDGETGMFSGAGEAGKSSFMSVDNNKFINLDNTGFNAGEWQDGREYFLHKAVDDVSIIKNTNDVQAYRTIQTLETRTTGSKMQLTYNIILPKNKNYAIIQIKHKNIGTKTFTLDNLPGNIHDGTWAAALNPKNPYKAYINGYGGIDFSTVGLWQVFSPPKNKPFVTFYDENNNAATYGFISGTSKPIQYVTNGKPRKILDAMVGEVTLKPGEETEYVIMIALHTGDETNGEKLYDDAVTNTPKIISSLYEGSYQDKKNKCESDNDCPSGKQCSNNKCLTSIDSACTANSECISNNCHNGACREQGFVCASDSDCPQGKECSNNKCLTIPTNQDKLLPVFIITVIFLIIIVIFSRVDVSKEVYLITFFTYLVMLIYYWLIFLRE